MSVLVKSSRKSGSRPKGKTNIFFKSPDIHFHIHSRPRNRGLISA